MIKKYLINFWIWWYLVAFKNVASGAYSLWSLSLANLNLLPMMSNLFVPMFQDKSKLGKFISFVIRSLWVIFGSLMQILLTIPLTLLVLLWFILPVGVCIQILRYFI